MKTRSHRAKYAGNVKRNMIYANAKLNKTLFGRNFSLKILLSDKLTRRSMRPPIFAFPFPRFQRGICAIIGDKIGRQV